MNQVDQANLLAERYAPLFVHPSEWARFKAEGLDMKNFRKIEPIPTIKSASIYKTVRQEAV